MARSASSASTQPPQTVPLLEVGEYAAFYIVAVTILIFVGIVAFFAGGWINSKTVTVTKEVIKEVIKEDPEYERAKEVARHWKASTPSVDRPLLATEFDLSRNDRFQVSFVRHHGEVVDVTLDGDLWISNVDCRYGLGMFRLYKPEMAALFTAWLAALRENSKESAQIAARLDEITKGMTIEDIKVEALKTTVAERPDLFSASAP